MTLSVDIRAKHFAPGAPPVLRDLRFRIAPREIVVLVGPSGCGKTTLLRIVAGLDREFDGTLAGDTIRRLGMVFQEPRLLPWRTVRQNLALVEAPGSDPRIADELLETLGLAPFRDSFAGRLSLGMARRVALARAFTVEPTLLLLDEPFVSLDEASAAHGRQLLLDVWARHPASVLLVTHDLVEAAQLADRILLLSAPPSRILREIVLAPEECRAGTMVARATADRLRCLLTPAGEKPEG